ncbi:hypothetical protein CANMA_000872 [Candida margitis]|uniref:uncharacterized protein n=1 Tax=Candida margitis TaxID=1775924 RepID=UPI0022270F71|nr:uncharacterized protein CANMA_000872 [Candida margitis]KAI5970048.1 hypothetical protein CANMA_000872 [Candida margitis]
MGLIDSVYRAFSRKDEDMAKHSSGKTELTNRPIRKYISVSEVKSISSDESNTPVLKLKRLRGKGSPRVLKTPTTIELLRRRKPSPPPNIFSMSDPNGHLRQTSSSLTTDTESHNASMIKSPHFHSEGTPNTPDESSKEVPSQRKVNSSFQNLPGAARLESGHLQQEEKSISQRLQDAFVEEGKQSLSNKTPKNATGMAVEKVQEKVSDKDLSEVLDKDRVKPLDKHLVAILHKEPVEASETKPKNATEKPAQQEEELSTSLLNKSRGTLPPLREISPTVHKRKRVICKDSDLSITELPTSKERDQKDLPLQSKRHKPLGTEVVSNDQKQAPNQMDSERNAVSMTKEGAAGERASLLGLDTRALTASKLNQIDNHDSSIHQGRKHVKIKIRSKSSKRTSIPPEAIDLSIFDSDDEKQSARSKDSKLLAREIPKPKETMAQKIKRLNRIRKAAKEASLEQHAKGKVPMAGKNKVFSPVDIQVLTSHAFLNTAQQQTPEKPKESANQNEDASHKKTTTSLEALAKDNSTIVDGRSQALASLNGKQRDLSSDRVVHSENSINTIGEYSHKTTPKSQQRVEEDTLEPDSTNFGLETNARDVSEALRSFFVLDPHPKRTARATDVEKIESSTQDTTLRQETDSGRQNANGYGLAFVKKQFRTQTGHLGEHGSNEGTGVEGESSIIENKDTNGRLKTNISSKSINPKKKTGEGNSSQLGVPSSTTQFTENEHSNRAGAELDSQKVMRAENSPRSRRNKRVSKVRNMLRLSNSSSEEGSSSEDEDTISVRIQSRRQLRQNTADRRRSSLVLKASHFERSLIEEIEQTSGSEYVSYGESKSSSSEELFTTAPESAPKTQQRVVSGSSGVETSGDESIVEGEIRSSNSKESSHPADPAANSAMASEISAVLSNAEEKSPFSNMSDLGREHNADDENEVEVERTVSQVYSPNLYAGHASSQSAHHNSSQSVHSPSEKRNGMHETDIMSAPKGSISEDEEGEKGADDDSFNMSMIATSIDDIIAKDSNKAQKKKKRFNIGKKYLAGSIKEKRLSNTKNLRDTQNSPSNDILNMHSDAQTKEESDSITKIELDLAREMLRNLSKKKVDDIAHVTKPKTNKANESRKRKKQRKIAKARGKVSGV